MKIEKTITLEIKGQTFDLTEDELRELRDTVRSYFGGPRMPGYRSWDHEAVDRVRDGYAKGEPIREIAAAVGKSVGAVQVFASRMGWTRGRAA